jgi:hypothetical protein
VAGWSGAVHALSLQARRARDRAPFPAPPHQTEHAVLPHSAFRGPSPRHSRRCLRLRGPIQCPLESSGGVDGVVSLSGIHQPLPPVDTQTKYGPFPPPRFCCRDIISTMGRSDSRSALTPFTGLPLIGLDAPRPPSGWHPQGLSAGAETGLSCSHTGGPTVPRPLRRRVLRGCPSQVFTPSMAFAQRHEARLPVAPALADGASSRRGRLRFMLRTGRLHRSETGLTPRFAARVSPHGGGLLQRWLGPSFGRTSTD